MPRPFTLLIKPASADCNLRCEYCFYLPKAALYPQTTVHRMPDEVLERMVASYMATDQPQYVFGWQGGEPTLMGVDFFRRATELQVKYGRPGSVVANGLQTNATLVTDELAEHLGRYKFLVGVSIDGPPEIHDRYRKTAGGQATHAKVLRAIKTLDRYGVEYNALVLVNAANVGRSA
ncbi:MAG: radical SAM protein, partial [Armatimonadetes bacterium]|nr:radical SAM protein [Armatimonadota bacterium]